MLYRRIAERVRRIAPFITYDPDPYFAISEGRFLWVQDAPPATGIPTRPPRAA